MEMLLCFHSDAPSGWHLGMGKLSFRRFHTISDVLSIKWRFSDDRHLSVKLFVYKKLMGSMVILLASLLSSLIILRMARLIPARGLAVS